MSSPHLRAVVLDIEGTTSSTGFVHATLYPYSRARFRSWIDAHVDREDVQAQIRSVRKLAAEPGADVERVVWWLEHWLDADRKVTPLKAFQGWIWADGFAEDEITSHFFDDVIPALRRWDATGHELSVFSSGSVSAQLAWFGHTPAGNLLPLFGGRHFDTENTGPKKTAASYERIAHAFGVEPTRIVFLSDLVGELDAASDAGWHTVGVRRAGDQYFDEGVGSHAAITSFTDLDLSGSAPSVRSGR